MTKGLMRFRFIDQDRDYTFRYYPDGSVDIIDNATNAKIKPKELSGPSLEFYAKKNLLWIKAKLQEASRGKAG